jgi:hypothetical protein
MLLIILSGSNDQNEYVHFIHRDKIPFFAFQQLDILSGFLGQTNPSNSLEVPDFIKMFNAFTPETLEFLCVEPLINLIPNDPILNYIFGVGRLFELVNTFMTIITSTDRIRCFRNANTDYTEISQFLRLNQTVGLVTKRYYFI